MLVWIGFVFLGYEELSRKAFNAVWGSRRRVRPGRTAPPARLGPDLQAWRHPNRLRASPRPARPSFASAPGHGHSGSGFYKSEAVGSLGIAWNKGIETAESKTRTYRTTGVSGRGTAPRRGGAGGGRSGRRRGLFAQATTDSRALRGFDDNCPGRPLRSTNKRSPI